MHAFQDAGLGWQSGNIPGPAPRAALKVPGSSAVTHFVGMTDNLNVRGKAERFARRDYLNASRHELLSKIVAWPRNSDKKGQVDSCDDGILGVPTPAQTFPEGTYQKTRGKQVRYALLSLALLLLPVTASGAETQQLAPAEPEVVLPAANKPTTVQPRQVADGGSR